ncbi:2,3-bisphosphoglycerate-independent phosphoglycerate mutase [Thiohalomonas denitrificans]|uniref:2,3-bisphosphoglycerate-independent phosphoglycerate mutase n=1 Tax=Thiohalomonas denitrificans TaxID=415747 RepID=A0A1G5QS85_9GAMM|nr:2,3-bisphosphoglycerate-independent phosphoglycerate mutase [Thiohalomonas denitrificans]SCZ64602.1 phosphoglycerate mutase [Thiohalomonas denitrificans]
MQQDHGAPRRPVVLVILDGFGVNPSKVNNAVAEADTPRLDSYFSRYPHNVIQASGLAVGLPDGQMGNSEVGHTTLGCGTVVRQDLVLINDAIGDGSFFEKPALVEAADAAAASGRPLHLFGLVSAGGVHSHVRHLLALIELCERRGARPLLHMFTDGRDTPPKAARSCVTDVEAALAKAGGAIATVIGRYWAMDRDKNWERIERAWRAMVHNEGATADSARDAIEQAYAEGQTDEFIPPTVLPPAVPIEAGDHAISFNFRKDRPRQIVAALAMARFDGFERGDYHPIPVACMMEYDKRYGLPFAFVPERPATTLSKVISEAGLKQFHCAETEKAAHVTYFFNGGRSEPVSGEEHKIIPSAKVATYDLKPEMSAVEIADCLVEALHSDRYAFIVVNFANGDMVAHSAIREAVIRAVEVLDEQVGRVLDAAVACDYSVIVTADHGNCEQLVDPGTDAPHTQHTEYPVPVLVIDSVDWRLSTSGGLGNIAPSVLHLMGLPKPPQMKEDSLLLHPLR